MLVRDRAACSTREVEHVLLKSVLSVVVCGAALASRPWPDRTPGLHKRSRRDLTYTSEGSTTTAGGLLLRLSAIDAVFGTTKRTRDLEDLCGIPLCLSCPAEGMTFASIRPLSLSS